MKMENLKKKVGSFAVAVMTTVLLTAPVFAEEPLDKTALIEDLLSRRNSVSVSIKSDEEMGLETSELEAEIDEIDKQLTQMGVETLTTQEVLARFENNDSEIMPYAATPNSDNIEWYSWRRTVSTGPLKKYVVETLVASVKDQKPSSLLETGTVTLQNTKSWEAGALAVLKMTGKKGVNYLLNQNSTTKIAKNVYDYAKAYISSLSTKTVIKNVKASYTYNSYSTVSFKYVKNYDDSDSKMLCSFVSTKCEVALHGAFPTFVCANGTSHPGIVSFDEQIIASPNNFNNNLTAVQAFLSPYAQSRAYLDGLDLYGVEGKKLVTVCTMRPQFPAHLI